MSKNITQIAETISIANILPGDPSFVSRLFVPLLDKLVGITKLDRLYKQHSLRGLDKETFAQRIIDALELNVTGIEELKAKIPKEGPVVLASNHPFGCIEGVILSLVIGQVRPDLKVLVNQGLKLFPELNDYFIYTNPLSERSPTNGPSLRQCKKHVQAGNALLIFPAGRVSYYRDDKGRITDHDWNRVVGRLIQSCDAQFVPIYVDGLNSPLFYRLGRIWYRFRLLMLARELIKKKGHTIGLHAGNAVLAKHFNRKIKDITLTALTRAQSYLQAPEYFQPWAPDPVVNYEPIAESVAGETILNELAQLPDEQHLLDYKGWGVYYGYQHQIPNVVHEIARGREVTFRELNEGSGQPIDTDVFDATYVHMFIVETETGKLVGAYRMGETDKLIEKDGLDGLYLSRMFNFTPDFINQKGPCLEMGRSFLAKEFQGSYHGLYTLWLGIGTFLTKNPKYRYLYGTVSLSKLYDPRSVAAIEQAVVTPTNTVTPKVSFDLKPAPEVVEFDKEHGLRDHLKAILTELEDDGKDIPILLKHYMNLNADFHCLGIDANFNDTPGLLLSLDLSKTEPRLVKKYLGENAESYLEYNN
jgi:putative hemolysin